MLFADGKLTCLKKGSKKASDGSKFVKKITTFENEKKTELIKDQQIDIDGNETARKQIYFKDGKRIKQQKDF